MDWDSLLSSARLGDPDYAGQANRSIFMQDYDRIVFSAPFRRLANKTQVQPLYEHDHVHHRLIHSIEVSSVGRSLATAIGQWMIAKGHAAPGADVDMANIVQAACAAHDIGNPPFGHSGEAAIGAWFDAQFAQPKGLFSDLDAGIQQEFRKFEGNAQGFRIVTRSEMYRNAGGMRLSHAVLGAFMKYPLTAGTSLNLTGHSAPGYYGNKKFGIFQSEWPLFAEAAAGLGLPQEGQGASLWWRRHPLVYVVEAADDICYNIVDLEDAFTTGELSFDVVRDRLIRLSGANRDLSGKSPAEVIAMLRALSIGAGINSCLEAFKTHYAAIMAGTFSGSLLDGGPLAAAFAEIKDLAGAQIFTAPRKTELEISGHRIIANVLTGVLPVYEQLASSGWDATKLGGHTQQIARALDLDLRDISGADQALHGLTDFVSGMTDRYALRVSRMLSGT